MKAVIASEWIKYKRNPIWLIVFCVPLLPAVMGTFNYLANREILVSGWYSLWTQHAIFTSLFFLPLILAIYAAQAWRLERTNNNWNMVFATPTQAWQLYLAKWSSTLIVTCITVAWIILLYLLSGFLIGIDGQVPADVMAWFGLTCLAAACVLAIQLYISLLIKSFVVPIAFAFLATFIGIGAAVKGFADWFPYSFIATGMHALNPKVLELSNQSAMAVNALLFSAVFSLLTIWLLGRREQ